MALKSSNEAIRYSSWTLAGILKDSRSVSKRARICSSVTSTRSAGTFAPSIPATSTRTDRDEESFSLNKSS